jgi:Fe-S-cluster containining protein
MGSVLCEHCTGVCCRYIALPIEKPTNRRDFDDLRWYVMHEGISIFVEEGDWYVQFAARCRNLGPDNRCTSYHTRPMICREYDAGDCDYTGGDYQYELLLRTTKDVEQYAAKKLGKRGVFREPPAPPERTSDRKLKKQKGVCRNG